MEQNRTCKECKIEKPIADFNKTGSKKYYNRICRSCQYLKQKENPKRVMCEMLSSARRRCRDKNDPRYGGRGIKFSIKNKEFYEKFSLIVERYLKLGLTPSIDRIDVDGNYEMSNVQIIPNQLNTLKMNIDQSSAWKNKRLLKESAPTKDCIVCHKSFPTKDYYISKNHEDGTVSRYNTCPSCEQEKRLKNYVDKPYYKGRSKQT